MNNVSLGHLRWTVDEAKDFEFVTKVYEALYPVNSAFTTGDILQLLERNPALTRINNDIGRNEGTKKSLGEDKIFLAQRAA